MSKSELVNLIENGRDINFIISGRRYGIFTWTEKGICIGEDYCEEKDLQYYATAQALVENFKVNGVPLGDLAAGICITDYS